MRIAICGSVSFAAAMRDTEAGLKRMGHDVVLPSTIAKFNLGSGADADRLKKREGYITVIKPEAAKRHFDEIRKSDAILVVNEEKNGISGYIGGATFSEIMMAFYFGKRIFMLNPIPAHERLAVMRDELESVRPVVLNGDISRIE